MRTNDIVKPLFERKLKNAMKEEVSLQKLAGAVLWLRDDLNCKMNRLAIYQTGGRPENQ